MPSNSIENANQLLREETCTAEEVQRLFDEWWPKRIDAEVKSDADWFYLAVESKECDALLTDQPQFFITGVLSFPRQKLSDAQLAMTASAEECQKLFDEWWPKRTGKVKIAGGKVLLSVEAEYFGGFGMPLNCTRERYFPRNMLSRAQLEKLSMSFVMWGAGRAAAIALLPLPLADIGPLMANEAYMIHRVAEVYGFMVEKEVVAMLAGVTGGSLAGKFFASFLPFLKVAIAPSVTYAVGKAAMAYFASGMTLSEESLKKTAQEAGKEASQMDWEHLKVENSEKPEGPENQGNSGQIQNGMLY